MNIPPKYTEVADRFGSVAQRFCGVVDAVASLDRTEFLVQVYGVLPQLIGEAISLPDVKFSEDENPDQERIKTLARDEDRSSQIQQQQLYELLKEKLGEWNLYWQVFDPTKDNEAIHGSLADDIADIYRDLKEQLVLMEAERALPEDNIWEWRFGFYSHWGKHAIDALRITHFLLQGRH